MEETLKELKSVWKNLRKSPGRTYTKQTVDNKLEYIEELKGQFELFGTEDEEDKDAYALKLEFDKTYKLIENYLITNTKKQLETKNKMAAFSLETVSKALPLFAGNHEELQSFLITAELIEKTLSDTAKQDFLQYIYHAKLTTSVRTAIGSYSKPENFVALKALLEQRYRSTKTIPELQSKLSATYQGKLSVDMYRDRIMTIIDNLNKLGIEELGASATEAEKNVIIRLNTKLALESFKRGINENLKTAIFAARSKTMQEAVELAIELENEHKLSDTNVMHIQRRKNNNDNNNYRNNNNQRNNYNGPRNLNNNFNRNNNSYNNNNMNRNNNSYNGNNNRNNNHNGMRNGNNDRNSNNRSNYNNNFRRNQNNMNRNINNNNNNRRYIRTIQDEGNEMGSEYMDIPDSQN